MSPALTEPARSKERAALEIAVKALDLIAAHESKTLISVESSEGYSVGAHRAFGQMAGIATDALRDIRAIVPEGK